MPEQPKQDNADDGGTHSIQINAVPMMTRDDEGLASGLLTSGKWVSELGTLGGLTGWEMAKELAMVGEMGR